MRRRQTGAMQMTTASSYVSGYSFYSTLIKFAGCLKESKRSRPTQLQGSTAEIRGRPDYEGHRQIYVKMGGTLPQNILQGKQYFGRWVRHSSSLSIMEGLGALRIGC